MRYYQERLPEARKLRNSTPPQASWMLAAVRAEDAHQFAAVLARVELERLALESRIRVLEDAIDAAKAEGAQVEHAARALRLDLRARCWFLRACNAPKGTLKLLDSLCSRWRKDTRVQFTVEARDRRGGAITKAATMGGASMGVVEWRQPANPVNYRGFGYTLQGRLEVEWRSCEGSRELQELVAEVNTAAGGLPHADGVLLTGSPDNPRWARTFLALQSYTAACAVLDGVRNITGDE